VSNHEHRYILAIDLGTTGAKVGLYSTIGELIAFEFEETPLHLLPGGGAEQSPHDWWGAIKTALQRLLNKKLIPVEEIVVINCTTQWSGTVAVDRDGNPLMNAIIWMDSRGSAHVKKITDGLIKVEGFGIGKLLTWLRLTGGIPAHAGKDSIAHILYIKNEMPEIYQTTYKFLEPKDYLNLRLTGKYTASYDSITIHWLTDNRDLSKIDYNDQLISMSTLDREKLPELIPPNTILGPIHPQAVAQLGLHENIQVVVGTPDLQSAAIGSGAVRDCETHFYIGTSAWLACHVPYKKTDVFHNIASLPSARPDRYLVSNEQQTAGACLTYLRDKLFFHQDELSPEAEPADIYQIFDRIAETVPTGSGRLIFTPWLYGERTPVDDHTIRGGFHNLSLQTTREHLIRAVFEGVAYNARWLLGYVEKFVGQEIPSINVVGGGGKSDVWCQILADVLNRRINQVEKPILANLRGAALLASVALGVLDFDQIPDHVQIANTYQPNHKSRSIYDQLFKEFVELYKRNWRMYARLNAQTKLKEKS
jgi:xylulokinase